jgi:hypothetical protein
MRSPPQSTFDSEPTVITGPSLENAAIGGGGSAPRVRSASVSSSTMGTLLSSAMRAISRRAASDTTAPVGLWKVGTR